MNTITHENQSFEISTDGGDIILHGIHRDLIMEGGHEALKESCEQYLIDEGYDRDMIDSAAIDYTADQSIEGFINENLKAGKFTEFVDHNPN